MTQITYYLGLVFFSIIVGLLGIFYRNILKMPNMIFNPLYKIFEKMVCKGGILKFIAYPLGYCIYCSTAWIAILGFFTIYKCISWDILVPIAISHYIIVYFCVNYSDLPGFNSEDTTRLSENEIRKALEMTYDEYQELMNTLDKIK